MPYTPNRRQIPRRMDSMPTPVAIQLHDQPDRTVAEASVTVVNAHSVSIPYLVPFHPTPAPRVFCVIKID